MAKILREKGLKKMEQDKKRIMLITPMLHQGGFERICVLTAKLLKDIFDVYLVVFTTQDLFYDVTDIRLIDLKLGAVENRVGKIANIYKRVKKLKRLKKELCIDVSYSFGTTANIANVLSKYKDITWAGIRGYNALSDKGAKLIFQKADCVVSCTKTMEADINKSFRTKKSVTLYNPCDLAEIRSLAKEKIGKEFAEFVDSCNGQFVVSVGREDDLKGFWHLLKSFSLVKKEFPDAGLMIIGDGSYAEYKRLAEELEISDSVLFTGVLKNPFALLAKADVYALTSVSEGFPNALIEAMACGVACVSVNCKTGPAEILADSYEKYKDCHRVYEAEYGILTPVFQGEKNLEADRITDQEKQYALELIKLLGNGEKRRVYSVRAEKRAKDFGAERYVENIINMIEGR